RGKEGPLPDAALRRPAAAGGGGARGDRQAEALARGRAYGQPALGAGRGDHAALPRAQPAGNHHRAGDALGNECRVRQPGGPPAGRVDRDVTRVIAADDQPDVLEALRLLLKRESIAMVPATSPAGVLSALEHEDFDAALIDLNYARDTTSGGEGLDLLSTLRSLDPTLPVVVMTAWGSVEGAVEAMRRGARDYVQKPWDNARLVATLRTQIELGRALRRTRRLEDENSRLRGNAPQMIARSAAMQAVLRVLDKVAPSEANVLITGEHGTGKEVVARYVHASSKRA